MGSMARQRRAARFLDEFGEELLKKYGLKTGCCVKECFIAFDDGDDVVRIFYAVADTKGVEIELSDPTIYYDPEEGGEGAVARLCDFLEISEEKAAERLRKVELL